MTFRWERGDEYERYVGRWSRLVAREFVAWLAVPPRSRWLDVGCGTGALAETVLDLASPDEVVGVDPAAGFVEFARSWIHDSRARFEIADAQSLPFEDGSFGAVVSGLVLNFVRDPARGAVEIARVAASGATCAAYVWDYAGEMQMLRYFWDAAVHLDPRAEALDEGRRFDTSRAGLEALFRRARLGEVESRDIDVPTVFEGFDDYWSPFLSGQAPAPEYVATLDEQSRARLRDELRERLPVDGDGSIRLIARACAVRGRRR